MRMSKFTAHTMCTHAGDLSVLQNTHLRGIIIHSLHADKLWLTSCASEQIHRVDQMRGTLPLISPGAISGKNHMQ